MFLINKNNFIGRFVLLLCFGLWGNVWAQDTPVTTEPNDAGPSEINTPLITDQIDLEAPFIEESDTQAKNKTLTKIKYIACTLGVAIPVAVYLYAKYTSDKSQAPTQDIPEGLMEQLLQNNATVAENGNDTDMPYCLGYSWFKCGHCLNCTDEIYQWSRKFCAKLGGCDIKDAETYCYGNSYFNCHHCLDCYQSIIPAHRNWCVDFYQCTKPEPKPNDAQSMHAFLSWFIPLVATTAFYFL